MIYLTATFQGNTWYLLTLTTRDTKHHLPRYFHRTTEFIHRAVTAGGLVVVNCYMGLSRSASVVIAYLMTKHDMSFDRVSWSVMAFSIFIFIILLNPGTGLCEEESPCQTEWGICEAIEGSWAEPQEKKMIALLLLQSLSNFTMQQKPKTNFNSHFIRLPLPYFTENNFCHLLPILAKYQ